MPLGALGDRVVRHSVRDVHRAHDASTLGLSQDGIAGRLRSSNTALSTLHGPSRSEGVDRVLAIHPGSEAMLIALHKNARTTPAVRAEIAASNEPARVLAERFGITYGSSGNALRAHT